MEFYRARYESGCITVDIGFDEIKICGGGDVYGEVGEGVYEVDGLYTSLCEYFRDSLPGKLILESYENGKFEVDGGWVKIKSGTLEEKIRLGEALVEFDGDDLWFIYRGVMLHEVCRVRFERFVNEVYGGEIIQNVVAVNDGEEVVFKSRWGEVLRVGKYGVRYSRDFCLLFGGIEGTGEILEWLKNVAKGMKYRDMDRLEIGNWVGLESYVFEWGFWEIEFEKTGELKRMKLDDSKILVKITGLEMVVSKGGARRAIDLIGTFENGEKISEIFKENNKVLRNLVF